MLKHQDNPQTQPQLAAQVRVTPEELAAAITRLEARKDAGQRNMEGTVAIGEVVQQLGIDATPEELLAEVQAGRTAQGRKRFSLRKLSLRRRIGLYFAVGLLVIGLDCVGARLAAPNGRDTNISSPVNMSYAVNLTPAPTHIRADSNLIVGDASGKLMMLSEIGDNQPVHCSFDGNNFEQYSTGGGPSWTLIKHSGQVYVRGWMVKASPKVMSVNGIDVATVKDSEFVVPVTLPLDGFDIAPSNGNTLNGNTVEFHALNVHLDKHADEKW